MDVVWGIAIVLVSLPCWGGQAIALFAPATAERWKLTESEDSVDPVFYGDVRGETLWDTLTLWTMPVAGALLILGSESWAHIGLVAGGMYVYCAGRGVLTRREITRRGGRVGEPRDLTTAYVALSLWGLAGLAVIVGSVAALTGS